VYEHKASLTFLKLLRFGLSTELTVNCDLVLALVLVGHFYWGIHLPLPNITVTV